MAEDSVMKRSVLLVDDDLAMLQLIENWLSGQGFEVMLAAEGAEALTVFRDRQPDVVISDLIMPGMNGVELLRRLRAVDSNLPVILVTSYGSIPSAVEAIRAGADDYLTKPIHPDQLIIVLERALQQRDLRREVARLRTVVDERYSFEQFVTRSKTMRRVLALARRLADRDVTVLIQGESGSGKELLARAIHQASPRRAKPFVPVDCGALASNLLESELFGHVRGAFSGAVRDRRGLFSEADGGTLFLDEIGNTGEDLQVKLLRVLQEREIRPLGGEAGRKVNVRIIAATNVDLTEAVAAGSFREDLYYRLAVVTLRLPPLRERTEDIPLLCEHFLGELSLDGRPGRLEPAALERMITHAWPGNVRELNNALQRGMAVSDDGLIRVSHLPEAIQKSLTARSIVEATAERRVALERDAVLSALRAAGGNRTKAARLLKISRSSLYNRLRQLEIDD